MFDCCPCCTSDFMKDKVEIKVENTEKGIRIDVTPKDPKKAKSFQDMVKNCKDFCECEC